MWASIVDALIGFTTGVLMARAIDLPIWILCLVYFIVSTLVHIVGLYLWNG